MNDLRQLSVEYKTIIKKMEEKGFKFLSDLEVRSFLVHTIEFWVDDKGDGYVLELSRLGNVTLYKETNV